MRFEFGDGERVGGGRVDVDVGGWGDIDRACVAGERNCG